MKDQLPSESKERTSARVPHSCPTHRRREPLPWNQPKTSLNAQRFSVTAGAPPRGHPTWPPPSTGSTRPLIHGVLCFIGDGSFSSFCYISRPVRVLANPPHAWQP